MATGKLISIFLIDGVPDGRLVLKQANLNAFFGAAGPRGAGAGFSFCRPARGLIGFS